MPNDFDHQSYDRVNDIVSAKSSLDIDAWGKFAASWNGVCYRFRACTDHSHMFTEAITAQQDSESRYIQERELFSFFVSGLSVIESFCFALFALGRMLQPLDFPLLSDEDERKVKPCETSKKYQELFPNDEISQELARLVGVSISSKDKSCKGADTQYTEWLNVRNILAHRASTTRLITLQTVNSGLKRQAPQWKRMPKFEFDQNTTESRRIWLLEKLNLLLQKSQKFAIDHFI